MFDYTPVLNRGRPCVKHLVTKSTAASLLSLEVGAPLERPPGDHVGARAIVAQSQAFAALSYILVKRIVDLQETLEFYELNWRSDLHDDELADLCPQPCPGSWWRATSSW
jgi:hypothetical protein